MFNVGNHVIYCFLSVIKGVQKFQLVSLTNVKLVIIISVNVNIYYQRKQSTGWMVHEQDYEPSWNCSTVKIPPISYSKDVFYRLHGL